MTDDGVRLNKFISESGVASRRAADRLIEDGRVSINGRTAVLGDKVTDKDVVEVDGKPISRVEEDIILAFNKPRGITCTADPNDPDNVIDFIGYPKRIYSVGRLDKYSQGLLLMTNNGELANRIMRSRGEHEKEYIVKVDRPVTESFLRGMSKGVPIDVDVVTKKCVVEKLSEHEFRIILRQGLNRQIRRMCEYFGYRVERLKRIRVVNIELGDLEVGEYRNLTKAERKELFRILELD
ncbi:MAG: pseudouridine synthase [Candidatus Methanomethylophilaceae archaeon]|jgi:23S rRNA pseudouridine2604 synthase|nr:pseudouridine synthase [Candidatus Methanomethylophilaceae archaeon]MBR4181411.1 pseudouridine synthase [Candidatus Methanomethylophilaceae archaeon]MBR4216454.1 pseudouridine synthase [Candidatus Methanomethylophilaceae archaeon]MBR4697052.1 pseudouridine synthase [Candidatus Methanomethylophilaceae archaeon]MBR6870134.1 pseudouridine synthase [Candidatus Methanomethylophilaceae archaeon]